MDVEGVEEEEHSSASDEQTAMEVLVSRWPSYHEAAREARTSGWQVGDWRPYSCRQEAPVMKEASEGVRERKEKVCWVPWAYVVDLYVK